MPSPLHNIIARGFALSVCTDRYDQQKRRKKIKNPWTEIGYKQIKEKNRKEKIESGKRMMSKVTKLNERNE